MFFFWVIRLFFLQKEKGINMRKLRNKFKRPKVIWDAELIAEDKAIISEYGLRRKKEIWAAKALVRSFRQRARDLNAVKDKTQEKVLLEKINKLGFLKANTLDDVLSLSIKNVLDRRLQTIVHKKGFAKTPRQARQFIVHGHVIIDGRKTSFPSYIVPLHEEDKVGVNIDVKKIGVEQVKEVKSETEPAAEQSAGTEAK